VIDPTAGENSFQMENLTLGAEVTDMNGNVLDENDLDGIYWTLDEDGCANGGNTGLRNNNEVINWDNAISHGSRNKLETWIVPGNPSNNGYNLGGNEIAWIDVNKEYFEVSRNEHRRGFTTCSATHDQGTQKGNINGQLEGDRGDRVEQTHDLRARIKTVVDEPTQDKVGTDNQDMLNVTARFFEFNTTQSLPGGFNGDYHATCQECTQSVNKNLEQDDDYYRDQDVAQFKFDFSNEEYRENYTIEVWVDNTDSDYYGGNPEATDTREYAVYESLGSGEGDVNINGLLAKSDSRRGDQ
jgi:hypothetical protein